MAAKEIVFDSAHIAAIEQDLGGDTVIVTFNDAGYVREGLRFWGDGFLLQQKISAIGIVTPVANWYPRSAMDAAISVIRDRVGYRRIITLGHGQGGYGALKFSAQLRATVALSFCPQWSINPNDVRTFDKRYMHHFTESLCNGLRIEQDDLCQSSFVFIDRKDSRDVGHAKKLMMLHGLRIVSAPFFKHDILRSSAKDCGTPKIISLCRASMPPTSAGFRLAIRSSRTRSPKYSILLMHRLIVRTSRSITRSSNFASGLLGKIEHNRSFYDALLAHAGGDATGAVAKLCFAGIEIIRTEDLMPLLHLTREIRFAEAEGMIAGQILKRSDCDTAACLQAARTLVIADRLDEAGDALKRLARRNDIEVHLQQLIDLSRKVQDPTVLTNLTRDSLSRESRVLVLFSLVALYQHVGDRKSAFRTLIELERICPDSEPELRRIITISLAIGEYSFAIEVRERRLHGAPKDYLLALDIIEAQAQVDDKRLIADLAEVMASPDLTAPVWMRASDIYEKFDDLDGALNAVNRAIAVSDPLPASRHRRAVLLLRKGKKRQARRELVTLLGSFPDDPSWLRVCGHLALDLPDRTLAIRFAEAQYKCNPRDPVAIFYLARELRESGNRVRANLVLESLLDSERISPHLSNHQWLRLSEEYFKVGNFSRAREVIDECLRRNPMSADARKMAASIDVITTFSSRASIATFGGLAEAPRSDLMARLTNLFRR